MDHEEMRYAYLRALNHKKTLFTSFCNTCKNSYNKDSGEIIDVVTQDSIYKVWYCSDCLAKELEHV